MFPRALILLLLVLNLGVATWWALRRDVAAMPATAAPRAPQLQLASEVQFNAKTAMAMPPRDPMSASPPAATETSNVHCLTYGPFVSSAALSRATAVLRSKVVKLQEREVAVAGHGWRVWLPALADREAARAMAARITAAGFSDNYVVARGSEANSIALGRYGNQETAQRQQAALQAAGFPANAEALGRGVGWVDVTVTAAFNVDDARTRSGAAQARPVDCASLR